MSDWPIHNLVDVTDLITCGVAKRPNYVDSGIPFLSAKNVKNGRIIWNDYRHITQKDHNELTKNNKPLQGDILYTRVGSFGEAAIIDSDEEFSVFVSLTLIKPKHDILYNCYLKYYLNSSEVKQLAKSSISGSGVGNLNVGTVRKFPISLPPIPEQKRIVAILDQAFAYIDKARANAEQNLKNARELLESYLQQVFSQRGEGWVETKLQAVCNFKHGFAFKSAFFVDMSNYVLLTPGNFYEEGGYRDRGSKQKYYLGDFPEDYILNKGDLLVAMTEQAVGLLGSPALIPEGGKFLHNQRLGLVQLTDDFRDSVDLGFLFHLFNTRYFRAKVQETATGLKVRHTSPTKLMDIKVSLPEDINTQKELALKLNDIKKESVDLESIYKSKIDTLNELKKSILQKAFFSFPRSSVVTHTAFRL